MARPVGLLRAMPPGGRPVMSWSAVAAPALVLGRSGARLPVDRALAAREGVALLGRSSGGGPVLWDRDLIALDVVLPRGHRLALDDVVLAYRWLGEAIATALRRCGVEHVEVVGVERARAGRDRVGAAADACFGGLSPFEVLAGGRKVAGLSQARRAPGTLLQAGIPMRLDATLLGRLLARGDDFARDLASVAAGLDEVAPGLTADAVRAAVDEAVAAAAGARPVVDAPTAPERDAIAVVATGAGAPARARA